MFIDLVKKNRSYRRFYENHSLSYQILEELVDLARLTATGSNMQPLKYILSCDSSKNDRIFPYLAWAGYLKDWSGPSQGERPSAYIIILHDKNIKHILGCDHGIAAQTILLGATEKGWGGCMIGSVDKKGLQESLRIPPEYEILLVIALGKPKEKVVIEPLGPEGNIKYWRDSQGVHHVPKRSLDEIILPI